MLRAANCDLIFLPLRWKKNSDAPRGKRNQQEQIMFEIVRRTTNFVKGATKTNIVSTFT